MRLPEKQCAFRQPKTLAKLKGASTEETGNIQPNTTEKIMSAMLHRAQLCSQEQGHTLKIFFLIWIDKIASPSVFQELFTFSNQLKNV